MKLTIGYRMELVNRIVNAKYEAAIKEKTKALTDAMERYLETKTCAAFGVNRSSDIPDAIREYLDLSSHARVAGDWEVFQLSGVYPEPAHERTTVPQEAVYDEKAELTRIRKLREEFRGLTQRMVNSVKTTKQLIDNFPELERFVDLKDRETTLPVPIAEVSRFREELGGIPKEE